MSRAGQEVPSPQVGLSILKKANTSGIVPIILDRSIQNVEHIIRNRVNKVLRNQFNIGRVSVYLDDGVVRDFLLWLSDCKNIDRVGNNDARGNKKLHWIWNSEIEERIYLLQDATNNDTVLFKYHGKEFSLTSVEDEGSGRPVPHGYGSYTMTSVKTFRVETALVNREILNSLLEEFMSRVTESAPTLKIHTPFGGWRSLPSAPRHRDSVILPEGQMEDLMGDIQNFFKSRDKYIERGITWKRGYLLTGAPGGGKTSLMKAVATEFKLDVHTIMANSIDSDSTFGELFTEIPSRSLIVFEDLDSLAIANDRELSSGTESKLTTAGLLNVIDGMLSPQGSLMFLSTNHPERLDPALIRPGRIDYRIHLGEIVQEQFDRLVNLHYSDHVPGSITIRSGLMAADIISILKIMSPWEETEHLLRELMKPIDDFSEGLPSSSRMINNLSSYGQPFRAGGFIPGRTPGM